MRAKATIGMGLGLAVSASTAPDHVFLDTGYYLLAVLAELVTGALLAGLVMTLFAAFQTAGTIIDTLGGFQVAQGFDPGTGVNGAQFSKLFQLAALVLLFSSDAYHVVLAGLFRSYEAVPVGQWPDLTMPTDALIAAGTAMLIASLQIAGPLAAVLFLADVGMGLVTRAAPALNAFVLGFPLKVLITLTFASAVFGLLPHAVTVLARQSFDLMNTVMAP